MKSVFALALLVVAFSNAYAQGEAKKVFALAKDAVVTVKTPDGAGTGFIIGNGKFLVTAFHVVDGVPVRNIRIGQPGITVKSLYAYDIKKDVAIFQLSKPAKKSLKLLTPGSPKPGEKIFVMGTPLGVLTHSITEGIVSAIRQAEAGNLLQITAAISPGSSGSPVLTSSGSVAGVVVGTIKEGQQLNFAVSASEIKLLLRLRELVSKLADEEFWGKAADELVRIGEPAVEPLIKALRDSNSDVRIGAADALVRIGEPAVEPLIQALGDSNSDVRIGAAFALGQIGDKRAFEPLINALSDSEAIVRRGAADALGKIGDKRAFEPLIQALSDSNSDVRGYAAAALGKIGEPAVEPLIQALRDSDSNVRRGAASALGKIGDKQALEPLKKLLNDPQIIVSDAAREAIQKIEGKE